MAWLDVGGNDAYREGSLSGNPAAAESVRRGGRRTIGYGWCSTGSDDEEMQGEIETLAVVGKEGKRKTDILPPLPLSIYTDQALRVEVMLQRDLSKSH